MCHLRSPILSLRNAIASSAFRIAPERNSELAQWNDSNNLKLVLVDSPHFNISVCLSKLEVTINIASLEYLWASIHAHLMLYDEYGNAQRCGSEQFDSGNNLRTKNAIDLLSWSVKNLHGSGTDSWPIGLPFPVQFPLPGCDIHVTNELFLCAVAWIIHHEICHVRLEHQAFLTTSSISEEKDADICATKWILDNCHVPQEFKKRIFGIATAILALQGLDSAPNFNTLQTHPKTFERIDYCLTAAALSEEDEIFLFASVIMQIQLAFLGVDRKLDAETAKGLFSEYLIEFARANTNESHKNA